MRSLGDRRNDSLAPALLAALILHGAAFLAAGILARGAPPPLGNAVPITIVSSAPVTDSSPAAQAPKTQAAAAQAPAERDNPAPMASPSKSDSKKQTRVVAAPPTQSQSLPKSEPRHPSFSLDALAASLAKAAAASKARSGHAPLGLTRARTAPEPRIDAGQGVSQSDMQGLQHLLERLWNPNCSVEGGDAVVVPVKFSLGEAGRVVGPITDAGKDSSSDPIVFAAARRAIDAVHRAEPYAAPFRGKSFTVVFDASKACSAP
ncbi:MAG: hypothetical protein ACYC8V_16060 [Caulobacteraceae bacterium]